MWFNLRLIARLLRKRLVLAIIFCLSFTYCLVNVLKGRTSNGDEYDESGNNVDVDRITLKLINLRRGQTFNFQEHGNSADGGEHKNDIVEQRNSETNESQFGLNFKINSLKNSETCRNSVQGKVLIADDKGYVCLRKDVTLGGCCDPKQSTSKLYSCETCLDHGCCAIYEHCISCCMEPGKQPLLQKIMSKSERGSASVDVLFASITDHFEFCLAKCRTSSQSVQHENSYRDPRAKHCYGEVIRTRNPPRKSEENKGQSLRVYA